MRLEIRGPKLAFGALLLFLLAALLPVVAQGEEIIHRFDSNVAIAQNGELTVTETIRVRAEGNKIRRGIFRDFPLIVEDAKGREHQVGFNLISVKRDGNPEPHHIERTARIVRIYIGDADTFLSTGDYTYELTYRTDRQIRFFESYDELSWNVTGNAWDFTIRKATVLIKLPGNAKINDTVFYTGPFGARDKNARAELRDDGTAAYFETTRSLPPRNGLTAGVKFAKGVVATPTTDQEVQWWLRDYLTEIILFGGFLVIGAYYFWAWLRVGRDPPRGVIVPRWDTPEGVSPALANYIDKKGFSGRGFEALSAALVSLAVKGRVVLEDLAGDLTIVPHATGKSSDDLPTGERALMGVIEPNAQGLVVDKSNSSKVSRLRSRFVSAIEAEHRNEFYKRNIGYVIGGAVLSVVFLIVFLIFGNVGPDAIAILFPMTIIGVFATILISRLGLSLSGTLSGKISAITSLVMSAFMLVVILMFLGPLLAEMPKEWVVIVPVLGLVVLNTLFFFLLGAPTPIGRDVMDALEGLKTYLKLAEQDRMNLAGAPKMSPQHFETLLPYAIALNLEKPWSAAFDKWLAAAAVAGTAAAVYQPSWYGGRSFDSGSLANSMNSMSSSIQSSLTASMPAPKSSSSGFSSGGSSGGGGGGGGGGGW